MLNSFVLCCNFCACKRACTVVVRSPRGWWGTVFPGLGKDKGGRGYQKSAHRASCLSVELDTHPGMEFPDHFVDHRPSCLHVLRRVIGRCVTPGGGGRGNRHSGYVPPGLWGYRHVQAGTDQAGWVLPTDILTQALCPPLSPCFFSGSTRVSSRCSLLACQPEAL